MARPEKPPRAPSKLLLRGFLLGTLSLAVLVALGLAVLLASLHTTSGTAWLLSRVPGLQVTQPHGGLLGDFSAQRVELRLPGTADDKLVLTGVRWRGSAVRLWPGHGRVLQLQVSALDIDRIDVSTAPAPASQEPLAEPSDWRLPLWLELHSLRVGEVHANALADKPVRELRARLSLSSEDGSQHRVDAMSFAWDRLQAQGFASVGTTAPLMLNAEVQVQRDARAAESALGPWRATLDAQGPLARLELRAALRAILPTPGAKPSRAPALHAQATWLPFAARPLRRLQAQMQALDLSVFDGAWPITSLSGNAVAEAIESTPVDTVKLSLRNDAAGRWSERRLPMQSASLELRRRADATNVLELPAFEIQLGNATQTAGRVRGHGDWTAAGWTLTTTLSDVKPAQVDAQLAEMRLSGSVALSGHGFNDPLWATPVSPTLPEVELRAALGGELLARGLGRNVRLELDAKASAKLVELHKLEAVAGGARLSLSGRARRNADSATWRTSGKAKLKDFDPVPWFPGREGSPWRRGAHRLYAEGTWDVGLPQALLTTGADNSNLVTRLSALSGTASITLANSVLAGVPLSGSVMLRSTATNVQTQVRLVAAGNSFKFDGVVDAKGDGRGDRWKLDAQAPVLARLAPALRLTSINALEAQFTGALSGTATVLGRWPLLRTQGTLNASGLRVMGARVKSGQTRWQLDMAAEAAAQLDLELTQASLGRLQIDSLRGHLQGTAKEHMLTLDAQTQGSPPAWMHMLQDYSAQTVAAGERTFVTMQAHGGLVTARRDDAAPLWRGVIEQLALRGSTPDASLWLRTRDVDVEVQVPNVKTPARISVSAGHATVVGAGVHWDNIRWQAGLGTRPQQIEVHAELEPLAVVPLLSRLQPELGWGGDLQIAGTIKLRTTPQFSAYVVLQRQRGDLSVTDERGTQSLGVTDLRLALDAHDGQWSFTQALAGTNFGVAAGAVTLHIAPESNWPDTDTPIQGVLEAQVAKLASWGAWVPVGWRLSGQLGASASIAGRFGNPEFIGEIRGHGIGVRNLLEGVNVTEGELQIALQGGTARIQRMQAKSGAGSLRIEGNASLSDGPEFTPQARLQVAAEKFHLLGRADRHIVASGQGVMQLKGDALRLEGKFAVDESLIDFTHSDAPSLSDDVLVVSGQAGVEEESAEVGSPPSAYALTLDVTINLGEKLRLRGRGLDTGLRGELKLTSPDGQLTVHGDVDTEGGTYAAYGQKLVVNRGAISFSGPVESPGLDIEAARPDSDVRVGVVVSGTALTPHVRLFSEPDMSDTDKLSYLVLGRPPDSLGGTEIALLRRAAMALLAGDGDSPITQLTQSVGLDEVSVRSTDGDVRETIVTLGKQLSRDWYVGYERGLNATVGTWQLIYRMAQRFTLRAQSGFDNSLDVIWTWRWQ